MKYMNRVPAILTVLALLALLAVGIGHAVTGDVFSVGKTANGLYDLFRVDGSGNVLPGVSGNGSLGSSTLRWGGLYTSGPQAENRTTTSTGSYSATGQEGIIAVTATAAARGIYEPDCTTLASGYHVEIVDESGGAASHAIYIYPNGSQTINGSTSPQTISTAYGHVSLYTDANGHWFVK